MDYFPEKPWACKCGCGFDEIKQELEDKLNVARFLAGVPFNMTSVCRCVKHNHDEGGKSNSAHLTGEAGDIECLSGPQRLVIVSSLLSAGFVRIGVARTFIHGDIRLQPASIWVY